MIILISISTSDPKISPHFFMFVFVEVADFIFDTD
jgi:hypothetical protein